MNQKCEECDVEIKSDKVVEYSKKNFEGKTFCFDCQKKAQPKKEKVEQETVTSVDTGGLIIRQCCIKASCELLAGVSKEPAEITGMAEYLESWIIR